MEFLEQALQLHGISPVTHPFYNKRVTLDARSFPRILTPHRCTRKSYPRGSEISHEFEDASSAFQETPSLDPKISFVEEGERHYFRPISSRLEFLGAEGAACDAKYTLDFYSHISQTCLISAWTGRFDRSVLDAPLATKILIKLGAEVIFLRY